MIARYSITAAIVTLLLVSPVESAHIKVLSAVGMRQVMLELAPRFERATGHTVEITFDATGVLAKRIASGEAFDVTMLGQASVEALKSDRKVSADSVTPIARSVPAVGIRKGAAKPDVSTPEAFKQTLLSAKSVARPSGAVGGASGDHIVKVLQRLGIAEQVDAKSVFVTVGEGQSASAGDAVASGKAEIALHQLQELLAVPGIEIAGPFPGDLQGSFVFSAAIGSGSKEIEAGMALLRFLTTPGASAVIRAKGMEPL